MHLRLRPDWFGQDVHDGGRSRDWKRGHDPSLRGARLQLCRDAQRTGVDGKQSFECVNWIKYEIFCSVTLFCNVGDFLFCWRAQGPGLASEHYTVVFNKWFSSTPKLLYNLSLNLIRMPQARSTVSSFHKRIGNIMINSCFRFFASRKFKGQDWQASTETIVSYVLNVKIKIQCRISSIGDIKSTIFVRK